MKKFNIKIALRNILRQKLISFITILGLSLGLAGSMFIFLWVSDELNFDHFNKLGDRLYRVEEDQPYSRGLFHVTVTPWPSGPVWKESIPEIENSCRITNAGSLLFRRNDKIFYEDKVVAVDSSFFRMFTFPLIEGDNRTVLKDPQSIVISEEMAAKYFGGEDPLGKSIEINNSEVFQVTGIMKKIPTNSSIEADFLIPFSYMKKSSWYSDNWSNNSIVTYVLIGKGTDPDQVNIKLNKVVKEHNTETTTKFVLFPFLKIHLHSYWGFGRGPGAIVNIWIFSSIALLVLIIACINFMNLSTARSASRAKETGLRKLNGAYRRDLVFQFFGESMLHAFTGMLLAIALVAALLGPFNVLTGKTFKESDLIAPVFIMSALIITIITSLLAGSYPAFALSSFMPIYVLKAGMTGGTRGVYFRKITVVVQFIISIVLILFTIVAFRQLKYMQGKSLGYDKENLIYLQMKGNMIDNYQVIKQEFLRNPSIISVSACTNPPQDIGSNADNIWWEGKSPEEHTLVSMAGVDFDYAEAMGIKMKAGRTFSRAYSIDIPHDTTGTFMINEQLEKLMGTDDAVGKELKFGTTRGLIIGVMKDFSYQSLRSKIEPLAVWIWPSKYLNFIYFKVKSGNLHETIAGLRKSWEKVMPLYPFDYQFLDQEIDKMYRVEERIGTLLKYFSVLAIMIACIGLFGLATYTVEQRRRELGLRKVLGASGSSIFRLVSSEFMQLLLIASLISVPLSIFMLRKYLSNFAFHIQLTVGTFVLALFLSIVVTGLAISYQLVSAIRTNPAKSLKYE
ncbi:MAG: ABC transporter permease [Bacteroidales bacterium]|jgi:predicted permease